MEFLSSTFSTIDRTLNQTNAAFKDFSPLALIAGTVITGFAIKKINDSFFLPRWGEGYREHIGRLALKIPAIREKYEKEVYKNREHFQAKLLEKWVSLGAPITEIPEKGWEEEDLLEQIEKFHQATFERIQAKQISGTIYSASLREITPKDKKILKEMSQELSGLTKYTAKLERLFTAAFQKSYLWNSLHPDEFPVGSFLDYQVIRMMGKMFGGKKEDIVGFVTSGGTESLMLIARICRNWGIEKKGHLPGQGVILAPKSIHAALFKASASFFINVELVDVDESGSVDMKALERALRHFGNDVVAVFGSAPAYPKGNVDDIKNMAKMAKDAGCQFHVDCCLGAFILNHASLQNAHFFDFEGVTSVSADNHKNGWSGKGGATLILKKIANGASDPPQLEDNLAYHSIFSVPDWDGGPYGTSHEPGSKSCVPAFLIWLSLLALGNEGYKEIAELILSKTQELGNLITEDYQGRLRLVAKPEVNVVSFKIDEAFLCEKGATYALAYEMSQKGIVLNTISGDAVHFCVTGRFADDPDILTTFKRVLDESLEIVIQKIEKGEKFSGDGPMYCALEAALHPSASEMSYAKYIENILLGVKGAKDAVKAYFLAQLDPFP